MTTDLITGFPEETEEEFSQTLDFLRRCGFAQMHIFPYSIRPGTPAAKMRQVPKAVKEERAHRAAEAAAELHRKYLADCVGAVYPVLFEQPRDGRYVGHAPNYMEVLAEGTDLHNQIRNVKNRYTYRGSPCWVRFWRTDMKSHFFAYISRMRFIQRWALMRNTAPENVQEHSHQVAVLAHALAVIRNEKFGGRLDPGAVAVAALYHDASEILTGDMPTPIKYDNPAIRSAYQDVEAVAERKLLQMLPPELQGVYEPILTEADPEIRQVVKAADKLSAYIKCVEELKAGNNEFREAAGQTLRALESYGLPEVAYFLETFMDSFSLTLDELK